MPDFAFSETLALPGFPGATVTAGRGESPEHLHRWMTSGRRMPAVVDIETFGVGPDAGPGRIKCVTLATPTEAIILDPRWPAHRPWIVSAFEWATTLVAHKAEFDIPSLAINELFPVHLVDKVVDTLLLARLATPGKTIPKDLDAC